eukprot:15362689-Ditylum_brightwellii.AAC.1
MDFVIHKEAEYIGGADIKVITIIGDEEGGGVFNYTVVRKSRLPFNVKASQIKKHIMPDIAAIPDNGKEYSSLSKGLTAEQCERISSPESLLPLQQEHLSWHHSIGHLKKLKMKILIWLGILPRIFKKLFDDDGTQDL